MRAVMARHGRTTFNPLSKHRQAWLPGSERQDLYSSVPYVDDATSALRHDGAYFATGRIYTNGSSVSTCRVNLTMIDSQGQHLWTRYLLYPNNVDRRMYGTDIISNDDSLMIAYYGNINGSSGVYTIGLIRLDTDGNIAWAKDYDVVGKLERAFDQGARYIIWICCGRPHDSGRISTCFPFSGLPCRRGSLVTGIWPGWHYARGATYIPQESDRIG